MKNIKYLFVLIFAVALSVSCSSDDDSSSNSSDLVGSWETTDVQEGIDYNITATFNVNNSGNLTSVSTFDGFTKTESDDFTWSTDRNKLTINSDGETDVLTYSISGNKLTMTDQGGTYIFTKQ